MIRQYVGARYVPKFASPVAWASGTSYEALTIVTFNNASYTSKVPVPPTVGNPADNPDYWALTGNYNAQVEQYRQETEAVSNSLTTEITDRKNADSTLQGQITKEITNRKTADAALQNNIEAETTARQTADNKLQGNINSEASTRASADSNLQSQINQIVAPSGEAPSAAEVQNARIGANGVTYDTLGSAVREQVTELKNDLLNLETDGTARFSAANFYNRALDDAGNFNSIKYRVSSREITTALHDCTLTPANGFRFIIYVYDESDTVSRYGWFTTSYNLSAGTRYKLVIARVKEKENASETANIEEFVNAILVGTYVSALGDTVENLKTEAALTGWVADNVLTDRVSVLDAFPQTNNYVFGISSGKVSLSGNTNYKYRVGSVDEGHKYHIKTTIGNTVYGYAFTDSNDNYLASDNIPSTTKQVEYDVIAPVGATKLYVNALTARSSEIWELEKPKELFKFALPSYYDEYLQTKLDTIHEMERNYGFNGATYAFITDFHLYANKMNSIPLLERIRQKTNAVHLIYGGDSVRALGAEQYLLTDNYAVASLLSGIYDTDYSYIFGNHDYTIATGSSWGEGMVSIPIAAVHSIYKKGFSTPIQRNYHYYDDTINQIRHIFIDYNQAGFPWFLDWFRDDALNVPSEWSVAFYCHTPFVANSVEAPSQYMSYLADWICAIANKRIYTQTITSTVGGTTYNKDINVDYTASTVTVIYAACGHIHKDTLSVVDGVTFFSTTCDAMFQDDGYSRTAGTTDEQAFDVITINKTSKTVNLTRIGAGENRSFTY